MSRVEVLKRVQSDPPTKEQVDTWLKQPPQLVLIDLSKKCNLWCELHCGYPGQQTRREEKESQGQHTEPLFIDANSLIKAYNEISTTWHPHKPSLQISADGEPLLHPDREKTICYPAEQLGLGVGLTTNGTLLTPKLAERFCLAGINLINISLDAATAETYAVVRPERHHRINYFERIIRNIENAVQIRNKLRESQQVSTQFMITMILHPQSINEQNAFIQLGEKLGVDKVSFRPLNTTAGLTPNPEMTIANNITYNETKVVTHVDGIPRYPCHFPFTRFSLTVGEKGDIKFVYCPHAWDRTDTDVGYFPSDGSLKELWQSTILNEVRQSHLSGKFDSNSLCASCPDWRLVTGRDQVTYADIVRKINTIT